MNILYSNNMFL